MSYQNISRSLDIANAPFLARLVGVYTLTSSDVALTGAYYGMTAGTNLYSFVEQINEPTSGLPSDGAPGRQTTNTYGNVSGQPLPVTTAPTAMYALEGNNSLLAIPGSTPAGFTNPGPYVEMRLRGMVGNVPVYEFVVNSNDLAWIKVTSSTASTINLGRTVTDATLSGTTLTSATANFTSIDVGDTLISTNIPSSPPTTISAVNSSTNVTMSAAGTTGTNVTVQIVSGTTTGYAAVIDDWSNKTGAWSDGTVVWLVGANTELPQVGVRYQCRLLGVDDMNTQIWATSYEVGSLAELNSTTLFGGSYFDGNLVTLTPGVTTGGKVWLIDGNG